MKTDFKKPFTVEVAYRSGAYTTCSVNGQRVSTTHSAREAVERLAGKLLGDAWRQVNQVGLPGIYWEIVPDPVVSAYAWRSGRIDIASPNAKASDIGGAIAVAAGPLRALQRSLSIVARHGQGASAGIFLVPGVPEANGEDEKAAALRDWINWCAKRNGQLQSHGVVFHGGAQEVAHG
jgi:hypothetical protein